MLAFASPGQPPGPASKLLVDASFGRGSSSRSNTATTRSRVVACRLGSAAAASSPTSFPAQHHHHEHSNPQQKPPRPSRRRPRPVGALDASARDNAPDAPRVFDASRGYESDAARERVELVLRLKDMGRRFEWRGALKVFRRARARGMVMDNSVYRSAASERASVELQKNWIVACVFMSCRGLFGLMRAHPSFNPGFHSPNQGIYAHTTCSSTFANLSLLLRQHIWAG